jgi:hypothetical protein
MTPAPAADQVLVHQAGEVEGGIQSCVRCGRELARVPPFRPWAAGDHVEEMPMFYEAAGERRRCGTGWGVVKDEPTCLDRRS